MRGSELVQVIKRSEEIINNPSFNRRLDEMLKERKPQFVASVLDLIKTSDSLAKCDQVTIWNAAMKAAAYDLPIDPNLGFAYIVPYGTVAQFQIGSKGIKQLALRSGAYKFINASDVREGELAGRNRLTGEIKFEFIENDAERLERRVVGYVHYFEMHDGHSHTLYMSVDELIFHAAKYSKAYQNDMRYGKKSSLWSDIEGGGFGKMCEKTVTKLNLSKNGMLSVQPRLQLMSEAIIADGRMIDENGEPENLDTGTDDELAPPKELTDLDNLNKSLKDTTQEDINENPAEHEAVSEKSEVSEDDGK